MKASVGPRVAAATLAALALAAGCGRESGQGNGNNGNGEPPPVTVSVQTVGRAPVRRTLLLAGRVMPESQVQLVSKVAGRIEELAVDSGDEVRRGQAVARVDRELLAAGRKQAEAGAEVAAAELRAADVALEDARADWKRARELFDGGAINEQARDKAKAALDAAGARRELAASRVVQARAAADAARVSLEEAELRSTIDGTVTRRYLDRGDFLNPGQPLLTVQDLRTVKVTAAVTQADLPLLTPGVSRARLTVDGLEEAFEALVTKVEPTLEHALIGSQGAMAINATKDHLEKAARPSPQP